VRNFSAQIAGFRQHLKRIFAGRDMIRSARKAHPHHEKLGEASMEFIAQATTAKDEPLTDGEIPLTSRSRAIMVGTSFIFSVLQSICTAIVAINGMRFVIGLGALAMTAGLGADLNHFHEITWLRITFLVGALSGSLLTLGILLRSRHLRNRPAARWRFRPLTSKQRRIEFLQIAISVLTLILVVVEECLHFHNCHTL
jgi:hypothetical protein